jgi:Ni/Co efflux regulator RcnB
MSESIKFELISRRRAFSLLGLAAAVSVAVPAMMLIATDADAQTQGMERRDERRGDRQERRTERRSKKKKKKETSSSATEKK